MNFDDSHCAVERSSNKHYETDIEHALRYTRRFFILIGIWPRVVSNPTTVERFVSGLILPISLSITLMHVVLLMVNVVLKEIRGSELLMMMGPLSFELTCLLKHVSLCLRSRFIKICIKHMETDWRRIDNEDDRGIMMKNLKVGHKVTIICSVCMYSGGAFYHAVMPLLMRDTINGLNETVGARAHAGADLILDPYDGHNYEIIFCAVCVASFFLYTIVAGACNLAAILVTHACGQIELIMFRLENLLNSDDRQDIGKDVVTERMAIIIRYHVRVLKFAWQIDQILSEICLLEVILSTIVICLAAYYLMTEWNNSDSDNIAMTTYFLLLIAASINVYIYCYVAYNFEWYKLPDRTGLAIIMVIIVANYPPRLRAGGMVELSIHTFGTIIRTSLGYLNMLRAIAG